MIALLKQTIWKRNFSDIVRSEKFYFWEKD